LHLTTPAFEATIWPTVEALAELALQVVVPAYCTGWRATHALAGALPDAFVPGSVGTRYILQ
jgi:7,8-dihydropterin-6-yl-methyl-4-(beta-D-ribofuranosyl)aminobenzene 5'-phosphate synthase